MSRYFLIVLFSIVYTSAFARIGKNKNYTLISQGEFLVRLENNRDVTSKKNIVVPYFLKKNNELMQITAGDSILAASAYLLKKGKTKTLARYFEQCDTTLDANLLAQSLFHFSNMDYEKTLQVINKSSYRQYTFIKVLLIADCNYELLKNKKEYSSVLVDYQNALSVARSENERNIVRNRLKMIELHAKKR